MIKLPIELIDNWQAFGKFWSVRLSLFGSALLSAFFAFPDVVTQVWNALPEEFKMHVPEELARWIPLVFIVSGVMARVVKQPNLNNEVNEVSELPKDPQP